MRKLIAWAFMYSLDGLLADEGTEYWQFCFGLPVDPADLKQKIGVYQSAYAHIMGRAAYEGMAGALPTADHPFSGIMNAARKVVFSRTLRTAEWANTTIAAGDTTEEIDKLRRGGDGHIVVWGGVSLDPLKRTRALPCPPRSEVLWRPQNAALKRCAAPAA
jgi:dihydrofolate reductase